MFCLLFFSFGMEDQRFKVLLLRCVCRKVTGQQKESVYSSLARCTLVIVTESTNSCYNLGSSRRDSELSPRSRCLQGRTRWPLPHQCVHKEEARVRAVLSNFVCSHAGRKLICSSTSGVASLQLYSWPQDTGF